MKTDFPNLVIVEASLGKISKETAERAVSNADTASFVSGTAGILFLLLLALSVGFLISGTIAAGAACGTTLPFLSVVFVRARRTIDRCELIELAYMQREALREQRYELER